MDVNRLGSSGFEACNILFLNLVKQAYLIKTGSRKHLALSAIRKAKFENGAIVTNGQALEEVAILLNILTKCLIRFFDIIKV